MKTVARMDFLSYLSAAVLAPPAVATLDWSFPGIVAAYAQRLDARSPFAQHAALTVMPAASIVKVLILLAGIARIEHTGRTWSQRISIHRSEVVAGSDTFGSSREGSHASFGELARAMITQSDNTAGNALVDWLGFAGVARMADATGLRQTKLRRHFMDFATQRAGIDNTTTARDMALLLYGIANGARAGFAGVSPAGCRGVVELMRAQEDRETIPAGVGPDRTVANKTGELVGVRHDIGLVSLGSSRAYVVALLSEHIRDRTLAFRRLREIAAEIDRQSVVG
jgi:beta-lactamase class A